MNKIIIVVYSLLCTCWMGCCGGMRPSDDFGGKPGSSSEVVPHQESVLSALGMSIIGYSDPTVRKILTEPHQKRANLARDAYYEGGFPQMFTAIGLNNIIVGFREMQEVSARNRSFLSDRVRETLRSLGASVPATPQQQDASQENIPGLLSPDIQISFPRRNFHLFEGPILRIGSAPHGDGYQTDICASTFSENPQIYHDILAKYGLLARQEIHVSVEASSPQAGSVPDWYRFEQANVLSSDFVQKYKDTYRLIITNRRVSYFLLPHELAMRALGSCLMVGGKALLTDVFGGNKHITQFRLSDSQGEQQYFFLKDDQSFLVYENWCSFQRNLGEHFFEGDEGQRYHMQIFDNFFIYQKTEASLEESILFYAGHAAKSGDPTNTDGLIVITRLE